MDTDQAAIIATELYRLNTHSVLGGVYKTCGLRRFRNARLEAKLRLEKTDAMNKVLRAMLDNDADQEKHWQGEIERIDAQRRQHK